MKSALKKELFIFDLDGTLADAYKAIEKSLNFTRFKLGYEPVAFAHPWQKQPLNPQKQFFHHNCLKKATEFII